MEEPDNRTVLSRLLEEISWEGAQVRFYRQGGRGRENVLTAEVLTALDYLPRSTFLAPVLRAAHGAPSATALTAAEAEDARLTFLPDDIVLNPGGRGRGARLIVQPDATIATPGTFVLVEAKGLGASRFGPEQLPREYLAVTAAAGERTPLLLLLLGAPPPVVVGRSGERLDVFDAINRDLAAVHARTPDHPWTLEQLQQRLEDCVAWTTWHELAATVTAQRAGFRCPDPSVAGTLDRLVGTITTSIGWHRR